MVTNLRMQLGINAQPLVTAAGAASPFAQAVGAAITNPLASIVRYSRVNVGKDTIEGWSIDNQFGRLLVLPDCVGVQRGVFGNHVRAGDSAGQTTTLTNSWLRLVWFDQADLVHIDDNKDGVTVYATVHEFGALKTFLPQMHDAFLERPALMRSIVHADAADLEPQSFQASVEEIRHAEPRDIALAEGDAPLASPKDIGDARILISFVQYFPVSGPRPQSAELHLVKSALYLNKILSWKRAFSVCDIEGTPALILTTVQDKEKSSSHSAIRQGLRLMLGLPDVDAAVRFQMHSGYCEPGSDEYEGGKIIVRVIDMSGTRMFSSGSNGRKVLSPAAQMVRSAFRALAQPALGVEVIFIEEQPEPSFLSRFR